MHPAIFVHIISKNIYNMQYVYIKIDHDDSANKVPSASTDPFGPNMEELYLLASIKRICVCVLYVLCICNLKI